MPDPTYTTLEEQHASTVAWLNRTIDNMAREWAADKFKVADLEARIRVLTDKLKYQHDRADAITQQLLSEQRMSTHQRTESREESTQQEWYKRGFEDAQAMLSARLQGDAPMTAKEKVLAVYPQAFWLSDGDGVFTPGGAYGNIKLGHGDAIIAWEDAAAKLQGDAAKGEPIDALLDIVNEAAENDPEFDKFIDDDLARMSAEAKSTPAPAAAVELPPLPDNEGNLTPSGYLGMCIEIRERQLRATIAEKEKAERESEQLREFVSSIANSTKGSITESGLRMNAERVLSEIERLKEKA